MKMLNQLREILLRALGFVGRHPLPFLILPSVWFFSLYPPFWKGSDVLCELGAPFFADNVLLVPPIYCVLGRLPFWATDILLAGSAPDIFSSQHPSLWAVYALVACQHIGLWLAIWYFIGAFPTSDIARGVVVLLLASIASFYSFAHTAGAEATTTITWFALFGVGLRILRGHGNWKNWLIYLFLLYICIGSRHVSGLILGWLPATSLTLAAYKFFGSRDKDFPSSFFFTKIASIAFVLSVMSLGLEKATVSAMCHRFGLVQRRMEGRTLCERIGSFLDPLSIEEKEQVAQRAAEHTKDREVMLAIDSLITVGTYYAGSNAAIAQIVQRKGLSGDKLEAEVDRITLEAAICFYETLDSRLIRKIFDDVVRGFYPLNDQGIAMTGPKATYASLASIAQHPQDWANISSLLIFKPSVADATLEGAYHDNYIRHWRFIPLGVWCLLFAAIGTWRTVKGKLSFELVIIALSTFGIGFAVYIATCACNVSQPRYVLPLWVGIVASGCILLAGRSLAALDTQ